MVFIKKGIIIIFFISNSQIIQALFNDLDFIYFISLKVQMNFILFFKMVKMYYDVVNIFKVFKVFKIVNFIHSFVLKIIIVIKLTYNFIYILIYNLEQKHFFEKLIKIFVKVFNLFVTLD